jgi:glucose-6-phosphate isomerase
MRSSGSGRPSSLAQRAVEEGVGGGGLGPRAFVEAGEDHAVAALQARFERAPDGDARMFGRRARGETAA